jgi:DNA-directed RNA polymerase specialized sigma24 family protein
MLRRGLFRAYLTTIVKRFLSKRFRESAQSTQLSGVSIHGDDELSDMELPVEGQQDAELERAWAQSILEAAFAELERDRPGDWLLLSLHYGLAGRSAHNLDELAERLGKKKGTLSTALHTLRQERLLPSILRRLGTGCSRKNYDEEKMWLLSELLKAQPDLGRDLEFEDMA